MKLVVASLEGVNEEDAKQKRCDSYYLNCGDETERTCSITLLHYASIVILT